MTNQIKLNQKRLVLLFCGFIFIGLICPVFFLGSKSGFDQVKEIPQAQVKTGHPTAYAIVIGVEDYPGSSNDLSYCADDMQAIRSLLVNELGYLPENIFGFRDSSATSTRILSKLNELKNIMSPDDSLFFYFSGHGDYGYTSGGEFPTTLQSSHPYSNNYENTWTINYPGADGIRVHFSRIDLEKNYDYIFIGGDDLYVDMDDLNNAIFEDYYTGSWTGSDPYSWSYWVYGDTLNIKMITDESNTDWGWQADKYEIMYMNKSSQIITYDGISNDGIWDTTLNSYFEQLPCQEIYAVIDACFSGAFVFQLNKTGRMIMTASNYTRTSLEDSANQHGLFTNFFLEAFERSGSKAGYSASVDVNTNGILTWDEIWNYVSPQTIFRSATLGNVHEPVYLNNLTDKNTVFRPTIIKNESSNFNNGIFSLNFTVYGSNSITDLTYKWTFSNSTIETHKISSEPMNFGTYEAKFVPTGVDDVSAYLVSVTFANGMVLNMGNATGTSDTDGDGVENMVETMLGTSPTLSDTDADGLNDYKEVIVYGTNATAKDTDGDVLEDDEELLVTGTSPWDEDCDNDGLSDYQEKILYLTDAYETDSDFDGFSDLEEIERGTDPNNPNSNPGALMRMYIYLGIVIAVVLISFILLVKANKISQRKRAEAYQNRPHSFDQGYQGGSYTFSSQSSQPRSFSNINNENVGYCINCGAKLVIEGGSKVCPYCGSRY